MGWGSKGMIYSGTFPDRPTNGDQLNVVNSGDTGRGKWAHSLVKHGKNFGANKIPAQGMLTLGRYWSDHMPQGDRDWWHARGQAVHHGTRYGADKNVNGYALFLMANAAAYALKAPIVLIPIPFTDETDTDSLYSSVEADKERAKFYFWWLTAVPTAYQSDIFVSAINVKNAFDKDPLKMTKLIGVHHPQEVIPFGFPPETPVYHDIPWAVNVGTWLGVHLYGRSGAKTGTKIFKTLRWLYTIYWKQAV